LFKGALVCGLFAAIFSGQSNNNPTVHKIYNVIIKVSPEAPLRQPYLSHLLLLMLNHFLANIITVQTESCSSNTFPKAASHHWSCFDVSCSNALRLRHLQ